jgi:hypothetical protein
VVALNNVPETPPADLAPALRPILAIIDAYASVRERCGSDACLIYCEPLTEYERAGFNEETKP